MCSSLINCNVSYSNSYNVSVCPTARKKWKSKKDGKIIILLEWLANKERESMKVILVIHIASDYCYKINSNQVVASVTWHLTSKSAWVVEYRALFDFRSFTQYLQKEYHKKTQFLVKEKRRNKNHTRTHKIYKLTLYIRMKLTK